MAQAPRVPACAAGSAGDPVRASVDAGQARFGDSVTDKSEPTTVMVGNDTGQPGRRAARRCELDLSIVVSGTAVMTTSSGGRRDRRGRRVRSDALGSAGSRSQPALGRPGRAS
jgi:hypothetical protein